MTSFCSQHPGLVRHHLLDYISSLLCNSSTYCLALSQGVGYSLESLNFRLCPLLLEDLSICETSLILYHLPQILNRSLLYFNSLYNLTTYCSKLRSHLHDYTTKLLDRGQHLSQLYSFSNQNTFYSSHFIVCISSTGVIA